MNTNNPNSKAAVIDPAIAEHDMCVEWSMRIWGRDVEVVNVKGARTVYPRALHPQHLDQTKSDFSVLFEMLVMKPILMTLNYWQRHLFLEVTRQLEERILAEPPPQPYAEPAAPTGMPTPVYTPPLEHGMTPSNNTLSPKPNSEARMKRAAAA